MRSKPNISNEFFILGKEKIAEILVKYGASVNIRAGFDMDTALAVAALNGLPYLKTYDF